MEENLNPEENSQPGHFLDEPVNNNCIRCGSPDIITGFPNKLCTNCRTWLIKFPIPVWVKLFGAGVAVMLIIAMIWLPQNFNAALNLARAEKAETKRNYFTEQRELEKALKVAPKSEEVLLHLIIAAFKNNDLKTMYNCIDALSGKKMEDTAMVNRVNEVVDESKLYLPDSTFTTAFTKYKDKTIPDTAYKNYIRKNPTDLFAKAALASQYCDKENYPAADSLLKDILDVHPGYVPALNMYCMVKRELNQPEASINYCDDLLSINAQNYNAMSSKARSLIKMRKNAEGLALAKKVYELDKSNPYNISTLVLAYHFNNDVKKRDEMVAMARRDSTATVYLKYVEGVVTNKVKYQN